MTVMRVNKTDNYTVMSNYHLKEKEMSLKAKGLLSMMLSLPDNWDYSIGGLVSLCKESDKSVKSALKELKKFGYLRITKLCPNHTDSGRYEYIYDIYEKPLGKQEYQNQPVEIQPVENQPLEIQPVENGYLYKDTNQSSTNELNTKEKSTKDIYIPFQEIVDYLNLKLGTSYRASTSNTRKSIKARFNEGRTLEDFKKVIDIKCDEWQGTDMEKYLRPETLFGTKFESYLNQKPKPMSANEWMNKVLRGEIVLDEQDGNSNDNQITPLSLPY